MKKAITGKRDTLSQSNFILSRILNRIFFSDSNSNTELYVTGVENTWNNYKNLLYFKLAESNLEDLIISELPHDIFSSVDELEEKKCWDLIFVEAPFAEAKSFFKSILPVFNHLSNDGTLLLLMSDLNSLKLVNTIGLLEENNIYPSCVLQLPNIFYPYSHIAPILVSFEKQKPLNLVCFIEYIDDDYGDNIDWFVERHRSPWAFDSIEQLEFHKSNNSRSTVDYLIDHINYERFAEDSSLDFGIEEHLDVFPGFYSWKALMALGRSESDYKEYKRSHLKDIVKEIHLTRDAFSQMENSVYIPLIGTQKATTSIEEIKIKHQNICQVVVDEKVILSTYLKSYLNSDWGRAIWEVAANSKPGLIKRLTKKDIGDLVVALPSIKMQLDIYETTSKIENAIDELRAIHNTLSINPISSDKEREKLDLIVEVVAGFVPLLREESKVWEFKASLETPYPDFPEPEVDDNNQSVYRLGNKEFRSKKQIKKFLQFIVLKTIASFINTVGGTLVIGIHEKDNIKKLVGIDREGIESHDKYERHLSQLISNTFSKLVASKYVSTKIEQHEGMAVCIVKCEKRRQEMPVFLEGEAYTRNGSIIEKLSTEEVARLVRDGKSNIY